MATKLTRTLTARLLQALNNKKNAPPDAYWLTSAPRIGQYHAAYTKSIIG
jgi:hypothetical protein